MLLSSVKPAFAHGFGQRYDLPVPLSLWIAGGGAAVALSFVVLGLFMRGAASGRGYPRLNVLRWASARCLVDTRLLFAVRLFSAGLAAVIVAAGAFGNQTPTRNLAPTAIWVMWWIGLAYASALIGDVWAVVNPWSALFVWTEKLTGRGRRGSAALARYPAAAGMWPAIALFTGFAWTELVFTGRAVPAQLAGIALGYSALTWVAMLVFGRAVWLRHGDPFRGVFGLLARFAPTEIRVTNPDICASCEVDCRDRRGECINCGECFSRAPHSARELNLRPFGAGLLRGGRISSSMAVFVLLVLSTITFDGFTATPAWATIESALYARLASLGDARLTIIDTLGLVAVPTVFALVYGLFAAWTARAAGRGYAVRDVAPAFVLSLIPIAIAYHLAHYFTYVLIQGQLMIRLISDPFGFGWDLFGTASYRPDITIVGARLVWYGGVSAIVVGHIVAVYIAHVIALREFGDRRAALRSQYAMLVLMVGYTMVSLWIIAKPIVEGARG